MKKRIFVLMLLLTCLTVTIPTAAQSDNPLTLRTDNRFSLDLSEMDVQVSNELSFSILWSGNDRDANDGETVCEVNVADGIAAGAPDADCKQIRQSFKFSNVIIPADAEIIRAAILFPDNRISFNFLELTSAYHQAERFTSLLPERSVDFYGTDGFDMETHGLTYLDGAIFDGPITRNHYALTLIHVAAPYGRIEYGFMEEKDAILTPDSTVFYEPGTILSANGFNAAYEDGQLVSSGGGGEVLTAIPEGKTLDLSSVLYVYNSQELKSNFEQIKRNLPVDFRYEMNAPTIIVEYRDAQGRLGLWQGDFGDTFPDVIFGGLPAEAHPTPDWVLP